MDIIVGDRATATQVCAVARAEASRPLALVQPSATPGGAGQLERGQLPRYGTPLSPAPKSASAPDRWSARGPRRATRLADQGAALALGAAAI